MKGFLLKFILLTSISFYVSGSFSNTLGGFELIVSRNYNISKRTMSLHVLNTPGFSDTAQIRCSKKKNKLILKVNSKQLVYSIPYETWCDDIQGHLREDSQNKVKLLMSSNDGKLTNYIKD